MKILYPVLCLFLMSACETESTGATEQESFIKTETETETEINFDLLPDEKVALKFEQTHISNVSGGSVGLNAEIPTLLGKAVNTQGYVYLIGSCVVGDIEKTDISNESQVFLKSVSSNDINKYMHFLGKQDTKSLLDRELMNYNIEHSSDPLTSSFLFNYTHELQRAELKPNAQTGYFDVDERCIDKQVNAVGNAFVANAILGVKFTLIVTVEFKSISAKNKWHDSISNSNFYQLKNMSDETNLELRNAIHSMDVNYHVSGGEVGAFYVGAHSASDDPEVVVLNDVMGFLDTTILNLKQDNKKLAVLSYEVKSYKDSNIFNLSSDIDLSSENYEAVLKVEQEYLKSRQLKKYADIYSESFKSTIKAEYSNNLLALNKYVSAYSTAYSVCKNRQYECAQALMIAKETKDSLDPDALKLDNFIEF